VNANIGISPPPQQTPITPGSGPLQVGWAAFFNQAYQLLITGPVLADTQAKLKTYAAEKYQGRFFRTTDTGLIYISELVTTGTAKVWTWVYTFGTLRDTKANLATYLAANYVGVPYLQTDTGATYTSTGATVAMVTTYKWLYTSGEITSTQALLPVLGLNDTGLIANVSDFSHRLKWSGTAWGWAPNENGSGAIEAFLVDPPTLGWALCDGSTKTYLKPDGTLGTITLPDFITAAAYLKLGTPASATVNPASAPTFTGAAGSGTTGSSITGVTLTGASTGSASTTAGSTFSAAAGGTPVMLAAHTHSLSSSVTDPGHTHTLTSSAPAGTISSTAEPANVILRPFFRR